MSSDENDTKKPTSIAEMLLGPDGNAEVQRRIAKSEAARRAEHHERQAEAAWTAFCAGALAAGEADAEHIADSMLLAWRERWTLT